LSSLLWCPTPWVGNVRNPTHRVGHRTHRVGHRTFHFRTTFLPPKDEIGDLVVKLKKFHEWYVSK
jgi:hypothetical protein